MRNISNKVFSIIIYSIQLIIMIGCFLLYTSTIDVFPWYEPLTMGAFMGIMMLLPVQGILSSIILFKKKELNYSLKVVVATNFIILSITFILTYYNESLFYIMSKIFPIVEVLLTLYLIINVRDNKEKI